MDPDVAKTLIIVTLCQTTLSPVGFDFFNVAEEGIGIESVCDIRLLTRVAKNGGSETVVAAPISEGNLSFKPNIEGCVNGNMTYRTRLDTQKTNRYYGV
jgi:hypothetical protein